MEDRERLQQAIVDAYCLMGAHEQTRLYWLVIWAKVRGVILRYGPAAIALALLLLGWSLLR